MKSYTIDSGDKIRMDLFVALNKELPPIESSPDRYGVTADRSRVILGLGPKAEAIVLGW